MAGSIIIVMGVSGSGKTSVGKAIARAWNCAFMDGDDLHPSANINKMSKGIPLTDEDREGWLDIIVRECVAIIQNGKQMVITCSALKRKYRDKLRSGVASVTFVYLKAAYDKVFQQLEGRQDHFMPVSLLKSQFAVLEEPGKQEDDVLTIEVQESLDDTVAVILRSPAFQ